MACREPEEQSKVLKLQTPIPAPKHYSTSTHQLALTLQQERRRMRRPNPKRSVVVHCWPSRWLCCIAGCRHARIQDLWRWCFCTVSFAPRGLSVRVQVLGLLRAVPPLCTPTRSARPTQGGHGNDKLGKCQKPSSLLYSSSARASAGKRSSSITMLNPL